LFNVKNTTLTTKTNNIMSKKVKVVCKQAQYHGKKMNLPIAGETEIGEDGSAMVSEEAAEQLVEGTNDWEYGDSKPIVKKVKPAPIVEEEREEEEVEEETEEEETEEEKTDDEEASKSNENPAEEQPNEAEVDKELKQALIRKFTGPNADTELKEMASKAGVSKTVIGKAKGKTDLINMILGKMELADKVELLKAQA
jgi:hypothetical protein